MRAARKAVILAAVLACASGCAPGAGPSPEPALTGPVDPAAYAREVARWTNRARVDQALAPLTVSGCVAGQALARARRLAGDDTLQHAALDAVMAACAPAASAGENLSRGRVSAQAVVSAWMDSPGHRSNILNPDFRDVGVGCVRDGADEILCSVIFIAPK